MKKIKITVDATFFADTEDQARAFREALADAMDAACVALNTTGTVQVRLEESIPKKLVSKPTAN